MRETLFCGKRTDDYVNDKSIDYVEKGAGEWVYGDIIHRRYLKNDVVVIRTEDSGFDNYSDYEVDPSTVGQYTGKNDKNGKMVFTNYIVTDGFDNIRGIVRFGEYSNPVVDGYHIGFYIEWRGKYSHILRKDLGYWAENFEVIGNIHDNPELLEDNT